jgi:hypothetical protein
MSGTCSIASEGGDPAIKRRACTHGLTIHREQQHPLRYMPGLSPRKLASLGYEYDNPKNHDSVYVRHDGYFSYTNGTTHTFGDGDGAIALARVLIERLRGVR